MGAERSGLNVLAGLVIGGTAAVVGVAVLLFVMRGLQWVKRQFPAGILIVIFLLATIGFWMILKG